LKSSLQNTETYSVASSLKTLKTNYILQKRQLITELYKIKIPILAVLSCSLEIAEIFSVADTHTVFPHQPLQAAGYLQQTENCHGRISGIMSDFCLLLEVFRFFRYSFGTRFKRNECIAWFMGSVNADD